jgi:hypothetical protein
MLILTSFWGGLNQIAPARKYRTWAWVVAEVKNQQINRAIFSVVESQSSRMMQPWLIGYLDRPEKILNPYLS